MQSSPPWRPVSPATSSYSIDLAPLEMDDRSGASTPLPVAHVDKIMSEDIDGPSDFTQNLEEWMRGGSLKKGSLKKPMDSLRESRNEDLHGEQAATNRHQATTEQKRTAVQHTMGGDDPTEQDSIVDESFHGVEVHEVSSEWDPENDGQTPRANTGKALLQPSVEDYHSELTPARVPSTMKQPSQDKALPQSSIRQSVDHVATDDSAQKRSLAEISLPANVVSNETVLEQQFRDLNARYQQLEQLNATLAEKLEEEKRLRSEDKSAHVAQIAQHTLRERGAREMQDEAHARENTLRRELSEVKQQLQGRDEQENAAQNETQRQRHDHASQISILQKQLEQDKAEHEQDVRAMEQELELERIGRIDADETARTNREELDDALVEVSKLKTIVEQGEELREQIKEQLRVAKMDFERLQSVMPTSNDSETPKAAETLENERTAELIKAQQAVGLLRTQLADTKLQLQEEQEAHERLRISKKDNETAEKVARLRAQVNESKVENDHLTDLLETERAAKEKAEKRMALMELVSDVVDDTVATQLRKKEVYWRKKLDDAAEERRIMAKVILHQWGREECGPPGEDGKQKYRYMFTAEETKRELKVKRDKGKARAKA